MSAVRDIAGLPNPDPVAFFSAGQMLEGTGLGQSLRSAPMSSIKELHLPSPLAEGRVSS